MGEYLLSVEKHCAKGMGYVAFFCGLSFFLLLPRQYMLTGKLWVIKMPQKRQTQKTHIIIKSRIAVVCSFLNYKTEKNAVLL